MAFAVTNTFTNGTTADADEVNTNFTDVENLVNGSGDNIQDNDAKLFAWLVAGI